MDNTAKAFNNTLKQAASLAGAYLGLRGLTSTFKSIVGVNAEFERLSGSLKTVTGSANSIAAQSPTYSSQAQGNQARLGSPIPVIYGRHLIYPDFASQPYYGYANDEQYVYQLHCIGQGEYNVEQIRIEDTPINSFEEITYQIINPGEQNTLFCDDVVTSPEVAGQELLKDEVCGPFVLNPTESVIDKIEIDVAFQRGLYFANNNAGMDNKTIQWRIDARLTDKSIDKALLLIKQRQLSYFDVQTKTKHYEKQLIWRWTTDIAGEL